MSNFEIFLHVGLGLIGEIAVLVIANLTHCDFLIAAINVNPELVNNLVPWSILSLTSIYRKVPRSIFGTCTENKLLKFIPPTMSACTHACSVLRRYRPTCTYT